MKMKFWDRMLMYIGSFLSLLAGAVSVVYGVMLYERELGEGVLLRIAPTALIIAGAVVAVTSIFEILLPRRYSPRRRSFVIQPTEHGELRIAVSAIENLILKCVETHKEVKVISMNIVNRRGAVNVALRVSMNSNVSIPHAVEQLQTQIKRYLSASSGIEVRDIDVSVERATGEESELTREALESAMEAAPAQDTPEDAKKADKISLHQRIFGRDARKQQVPDIVMAPEDEQEAAPAASAPAAAAAPRAADQPFDALADAAELVSESAQAQEKTEAAAAEAETVTETASETASDTPEAGETAQAQPVEGEREEADAAAAGSEEKAHEQA